MAKGRIKAKPAVELESVSLRLPAELVRRVDAYAKYLGGSTDRTHVITQALEIVIARDAEFEKYLASGGPGAGAPGPSTTRGAA